MLLPIILVTLSVLSFGMAIKTVKDHLTESNKAESVDGGLMLQIKVPKQNEQGPLSAEMFFAALHGLLQEEGEDVGLFSFEIKATSDGVAFFAYIPKRYKKFVESQIYAQYPTAEISEVEDFARVELPSEAVLRGTEIKIDREYYYPVKTFQDFEVDPLAAITSSIENLKGIEQTWFQMIVKPLPEGWQEEGYTKVDELRTGKKKDDKTLYEIVFSELLKGIAQLMLDALQGVVFSPSKSYMKDRAKEAEKEKKKYEITEEAKKESEAIREKLSLLGFEVNMRILGMAENESEAQENVGSLVAALRQFSGDLNSFGRSGFIKDPEAILSDFQQRRQPREMENLFILNTEELASVYHLPYESVATPNIDYIRSKKGEPPLDLPWDVPMKFARTMFRDKEVEFGIFPPDRRRHMYVLGKTGTGKTTMLRNMIIQDIRNGEGLCVIDPHGDLFDYVLDYIPEERLGDVAIFDPSDVEYPVALNMFELIDPDQKPLVASGMIEVFRKRFEFSWGPRMEHLLRNTFLTFLEIPHSTLLSVTRILTDRAYRKYIVNLVRDPILKDFWNTEYENIANNERIAAEAVAPIQNRLGPFLSNPIIRNMVGQSVGTLDLINIMNEGKIFLVNLSKGKLGEDNSAILGSFLVSRLWFSALTRSSMLEEERRDFHVYIDEFQNFATSTFASILSESRKYRLNMVLAHQYLAQIEAEGAESVKDAVFGNVGTIMCYVLGQEDAEEMAKEFDPVFDASDIMGLGRFELYIKLMIEDQQSKPFSIKALPPITDANTLREEVIARSRAKYGRSRDKVEAAIRRWSGKTFAPGMDDELVAKQREKMYQGAGNRDNE